MKAKPVTSVMLVALLGVLTPQAGATLLRNPTTQQASRTSATVDVHSLGKLVPTVVAGDPSGSPPDSPTLRIDSNTTTSPFAGVGSLFVDDAPVGDGSGFLGTASAIRGFSLGKTHVSNYILTAAHNLDFEGGVDSFGESTGDGIVDVAPQDVSFMLNFGSDISHVITAAEFFLHPDWNGFDNVSAPEGASINDDIAVIRLDSHLPAGVPTYSLATVDSGSIEVITSVGYGTTGDPSGYINESASFDTKRVGINQIDMASPDDEGASIFELFAADFDGPDSSSNVFDVGPPGFNAVLEGTLGNDRETTIGGGDSGGPSFLSDFVTGELVLDADGQPTILGINTFGTDDSPAFGSVYGGSFLPAYAGWVDSVITAVPEPSSLTILLIATLGSTLTRPKRRRSESSFT